MTAFVDSRGRLIPADEALIRTRFVDELNIGVALDYVVLLFHQFGADFLHYFVFESKNH